MRSSLWYAALLAIVAPLMSVSVSDARSTTSRDAVIVLDECQECVTPIYEYPPGTWTASWIHIENHDGGICPNDAEQCVRCIPEGDGCAGDYNPGPDPTFNSEQAAQAWISAQTNCGDCGLMQRGDIASAIAIATTENADALAEAIEKSDGALWLNAERKALQGLGCGGRVALNLPVDDRMAMAVATALKTKAARLSTQR